MKLDELHDRLFDILLTIDRICRENDLHYYLDGGTELGAVRDGDFIPWDDDMDIMVLVEDYQKFVDTMKDKLPAHMHMIDPADYSPYFYDFMPRIIDDRWRLREETDEDRAYQNYQNSVGTDICIFCGGPKTKLGQSLFLAGHKALYGMAMKYRYRIEYEKHGKLERMQIRLCRFIGGLISGKTPQRIHRLRNRYIRLFDAGKTGCRFSICAVLNRIKPMSNEWFQDTAHGKIRDRQFPLVSGYDEKLKCVFGNYWIPEYDPSKYNVHLDEKELQSEFDRSQGEKHGV